MKLTCGDVKGYTSLVISLVALIISILSMYFSAKPFLLYEIPKYYFMDKNNGNPIELTNKNRLFYFRLKASAEARFYKYEYVGIQMCGKADENFISLLGDNNVPIIDHISIEKMLSMHSENIKVFKLEGTDLCYLVEINNLNLRTKKPLIAIVENKGELKSVWKASFKATRQLYRFFNFELPL